MKKQGKTPTVAVIGGDKRMGYIAELLEKGGVDVTVALLDGAEGVERVPLSQALACEMIILPTPVSKDGETLFSPQSEESVQMVDIISKLRAGVSLLGGSIPKDMQKSAALRGVRCVDYLEREGVAAQNALPTAEGALMLAIQNSEITVSGSSCLVIGCGKCGRALARLLRRCGASVAVSARKNKDHLWSRLHGCEAVETGALAEIFPRFDFIFNTVPVRVVDARLLELMRTDGLLIELASGASGVDMTAAQRLKRRAIFAPSLPGKYSPRTAAEILHRSINGILTEEFMWKNCE